MSTSLAPDFPSFQQVRGVVAETFDLSSSLPDLVFKRPSAPFFFCQYDVILAADIWQTLRDLASTHRDDSVNVLVVKPDAESYFMPEYGMYPAFSLSTEASEDDFWDAVDERPGGDITGAIFLSANVVAIAGHSARWGIWGDRNIGLAVVQGAPQGAGKGSWLFERGPFVGIDDALSNFLPFPEQIPATLSERLRRHYS